MTKQEVWVRAYCAVLGGCYTVTEWNTDKAACELAREEADGAVEAFKEAFPYVPEHAAAEAGL